MPALITPLPPAPQRTDPANFSTRADALVAALPTMVSEINAVALATTGTGNFTNIAVTGSVTVGATVAQNLVWEEVGPFNASSGTAFDVNGIPEGVAEIEILFDFVSLSGTDAILVQIGAFGVGLLDTTGYHSGRITFSGTAITPAISADDVNPGFLVRVGAAAAAVTGTMRMVRGASPTLWHYTLAASLDGVTMQLGAGRKYLSTTRLSDLRITRSGTNTFDGGLISVRYR